VDAPTPPTEDPPEGAGVPAPRDFVRTAAWFYAALLGVAWGWSALAGDSLVFADAAAAERGIDPLRDAGLGIVAGLLVILLSDQLTRHTAAGEALARTLASFLGRLSIPQCVALAAMSGVAEEALFRGVLQPRVGLAGAAILFGIAHFVPQRALLPWSLFAFAVGWLFGLLFDATGNLVAPTLAHALINAVNLRLLTQRYPLHAEAGDVNRRAR